MIFDCHMIYAECLLIDDWIRIDLIRILEFYFNAKQGNNPMNPINFNQETALIDFQEEVNCLYLFTHWH